MKIVSSTYPAEGDHQVCVGVNDGGWCTWERVNGVDQKKTPHPTRTQAFKVFDQQVSIIKTKE